MAPCGFQTTGKGKNWSIRFYENRKHGGAKRIILLKLKEENIHTAIFQNRKYVLLEK